MCKWWSDVDRIKPKYMEKKNCQISTFSHNESHKNLAGIEILVFAVGGL
jgi:hypothetical protein